MTAWVKQPPIEGGTKGCLCCGAMHQALSPSAIIAVGFGSANATRDGDCVYDEQEVDGENFSTCADIEAMAVSAPDHDWRIQFYAPLYSATYQRHGDSHWVLIEKGEGFA